MGQSALLDLHVSGTPDFGLGAAASFITGANLTFSAGDGQTFVLVVPNQSVVQNTIDFQHTFIYPSPGGFAPEVEGSVQETEAVASSIAIFSRAVDMTTSLQVSPVTSAVPEPSTWTIMLVGFFGVGFMAYRRTRKHQGLGLAEA